MFQAPLPVLLRVGATVWLVGPGMSAGFMYMMNDEYGAPAWLWRILLALALGMATLLLVASLVCKKAPPLVLWRVIIAGVIGLVPILTLTAAMGLSYLAAAPEASRPWLWLLVVGITTMWCFVSLSGYKQRVIDRRFMEREFSIEEARIVVRQPLKTDLDPKPMSEHTLVGKLYYGLGPYLILIIPVAYPLQRLITDTAGGPATLLLLAVLGWPLTMYIIGRMACGTYLWVYKVWQMERQHGKPVMFDVDD